MSFAGATNDLPAEGSGADYSNTGANESTGAAQLPLLDSLGAAASDAYSHGTGGLINLWNAWDAHSQAALNAQMLVDPSQDPNNALIDPKEWQAKYPDLGLTFTPDMGNAEAQLLVDHKQDELRRQYVIDHAPNTLTAKALQTVTSFATSAVDPVNIAAIFVPGVGETRAGLWAAKYGNTGARLAEGATAGATGMAALQPLQAAEANAYQDHYGPMDAFMNVAFGTVLGGGLHAGFGKLSDFLNRAQPETREAALRGSVAQAAEGRPVDVEPILATDPAMAEPQSAPAAIAASAQAEVTPDQISAALDDVRIARSAAPQEPSLFNTIRLLGGLKMQDESGKPMMGAPEIRQIMDTNRSLANNRTGLPPDMMREALEERGWFGGNREPGQTDLGDLNDLIEQEQRGNKVYHPESSIQGDLAYRQLLDREMAEAGVGAADKPEIAARKLAEYRAARGADLADRHEAEVDEAPQDLSPDAQEVLKSHGYEPGADFGAEFEDQGGEGQAGGAGPAPGREIVGGGQTGSDQDARQAASRAALQADARQAIARARKNSLDFAQGRERSSVEPAPEILEQVADDVRAHLGDDQEANLADTMEQLSGYKAQGIISDEEVAALKEANAADDEAANTRTEAARAAARCLFLHP